MLDITTRLLIGAGAGRPTTLTPVATPPLWAALIGAPANAMRVYDFANNRFWRAGHSRPENGTVILRLGSAPQTAIVTFDDNSTQTVESLGADWVVDPDDLDDPNYKYIWTVAAGTLTNRLVMNGDRLVMNGNPLTL